MILCMVQKKAFDFGVSAVSSAWLGNLSRLAHASIGILELFPADGDHVIADIASRHNNTKFIGCC